MSLPLGYLCMILYYVFDLLSIYRLIVMIKQLYAVLSQQVHNLCLDVLLIQCTDHLLPFFRAEVRLQSFCDLSSDLLHDLHVRSLGQLSGDLNLIPMGRHLLNLVLGNVLIEDLIVELLWRTIHEPIVKLASVGLN